jgi:hypothetical protein
MEYNNDKSKDMKTSEEKTYLKEHSLKINNFNPTKGSPNLFMTKLQFRLRHYQVEKALLNDPLTL